MPGPRLALCPTHLALVMRGEPVPRVCDGEFASGFDTWPAARIMRQVAVPEALEP
ncbi:hypothetical protein [Streptomyces sp. NPDC056069]|uniref:hypothetical protein n=1 Tax=Streptomyces sp. NPDC056069 TaxID=3345702 RepID=UPI0035DB640B